MNKQKQTKEILEDIAELRYKLNLCLSGILNLLTQNNPNGINDYLIKCIVREL